MGHRLPQAPADRLVGEAMPVPSRVLASSDTLSALSILATMLSPGAGDTAGGSGVIRRELDDPEADLYLPGRRPAPGLVLVLGALREGRRYPLLEKAARAIARRGFAVLVPELGRLRSLVLGEDAVEDLVASARALRGQDGVLDAPVGLIGFSLGGSLALLAAADPRLSGGVACVAAMGAYFRLEDMLSSAVAGSLAPPSAYAVVASLASTLPSPDREIIEHALDLDRESPVAALLRIPPASVGPQAQTILAGFRDGRPQTIAESVRPMMEMLSPETAIGRIMAPTWVLHDERDRFVPISQFEAIRNAAAGRKSFTFFRIRLLEHTEPAAPPLDPRVLFRDYLPGLVDLFRFVRGPLKALRRAG